MICNRTITNPCSFNTNFDYALGDCVKVDKKNITSNKNTSYPFEYLTTSGFGADSLKTKSVFESESVKISDSNSSTVQSKTSKYVHTWKIGAFRENLRPTIFKNIKDKIPPIEEENTTISCSTDCNSNGSFLSTNSQTNSKFVAVSNNSIEFTNPLRLFNKSGKPLTDQKGRPLANIFGQLLVTFDDKGKPVSDLRGNQVFNSLGESAIYPTTNLHISPSEEEPSIPLLDIGRDNILFLYDHTGHPLTDNFGRPLLCASGKPMIGMKAKGKVDMNDHKGYSLKKMYSRKPLESFFRHVQIFDSSGKPLTDECGRLLENASIICNKNGMPMCDGKIKPIYFKYGSKMPLTKRGNKPTKVMAIEKAELKTQRGNDPLTDKTCTNTGLVELENNDRGGTRQEITFDEGSVSGRLFNNSDDEDVYDSVSYNKSHFDNNIEIIHPSHDEDTPNKNRGDPNADNKNEKNNVTASKENIPGNKSEEHDAMSFLRNDSVLKSTVTEQNGNVLSTNESINLTENKANGKIYCNTINEKESTETVFLFNATEQVDNNSSMDVVHFEAIKTKQISHKREPQRKMYPSNLFQLLKDSFSKKSGKHIVEPYQYNEYGKPLMDIRGNLLYDSYGMPLTGAHGRRLSEKARQALRVKLRNIPKNRAKIDANSIFLPLTRNESHDQFGEPIYDKYGRPLYDLAGMLIYDRFGRPLTDAFGRPLVDAIGQPLMDCEGRVLTSVYDSDSNTKLVDIFGRKLYDKRGRMLFDSYGRPKYDIFTKAIYDNCGRPTSDANGRVLFDFLNKPIQPFPEKPIYKNARSHLPKHIDTILAVPSMYRLLKYSQPLEDVFGGPLFDDLGRPLYNKMGKPLFDRYGRPLYNSDGAPLCDCYGRPLSDDVRESDDDQTLTVVDCLKLLKVTEESSKWMFGKNKAFKPTEFEFSKKKITVGISYKRKCNSSFGQYVYTLTRVTKFASGRQSLEILEAPLSPATVAEMHRLPVDNKPLVMIVGQRHRKTLKNLGGL